MRRMSRLQLSRLRACVRWGWPLISSLLLTALALAVFVTLARRVVDQQTFAFDQFILARLAEMASPALTSFMLAVSDSATALVILPLLAVIWFAWGRRYPADWIALALSIAGATLLNQLMKEIFERARPTLMPHLEAVSGYSFPSGHSMAAMAFYPVLAYLLARRVPPQWRFPIYILAGLWVLLVGLSRNYLAVHYPSDVLAAFAVTLPWALAVIFLRRCYAP